MLGCEFMDLINKYNLFHEDNTIIFRFDSDKDFICAIIDLKENFAEFKGKKIKVRFAQNGITTDLIDLQWSYQAELQL